LPWLQTLLSEIARTNQLLFDQGIGAQGRESVVPPKERRLMSPRRIEWKPLVRDGSGFEKATHTAFRRLSARLTSFESLLAAAE
jgi:hypothetical protein